MVAFIVYYVYRFALLSIGIFLSISYFMNVLSTYFSKADIDEIYDYIIIGGGTAGAVIAGRLARDQGMSVLLLEAGPAPPLWDLLGLMNVPLLGPVWQRSDIDWAYITTPQEEACNGLFDRVSRWPRGNVLGGSARLNNLIYLRGHFTDWDEWEKFGGPDWGRSSMLYYLKKSERQQGSYVNETIYHKRSGWLPVTDSPLTALGKAVLEGASELGFPLGDLNGGNQEGFMRAQITTLHGARFSPDQAFLKGDLKNLRILTHSHVDKVLINKRSEAYGVDFRGKSGKFQVKSRRGVVVSAGVIGSPKILMLSGIGPAQYLKSLKISVHADLPVGENLQDHVMIGLDLVLVNTSTLAISLASAVNPKSAYDYVFSGKGPWTHGGCEVVGVWRSNRVNETKPPDLGMMVLPAGVASDGGALLRHNLGISDKLWKEYFEPLSRRSDVTSVTLGITLLHPLSRGTIFINSRDPRELPTIDPNYLQEPEDIDTLIEGIDILRRLLRTKAMAKIGAAIYPRKVPGCKALPFFSRRYWQCYVRSLTMTAYHPAGTCRLGKRDDDTAVVDTSLRVRGIDKLYVADASVMPTLPSANPMAAVIAIAEKMADILEKERDVGVDVGADEVEGKSGKSCHDKPDNPQTSESRFRQSGEQHSDEL